MRKMGFLKSYKENEKRIALLPEDLEHIAPQVRKQLLFEWGYGRDMDIPDEAYFRRGAVVADRKTVMKSSNIICDPKAGDAEYLEDLREGIAIFGWVHPHVDKGLKQVLFQKKFSVYAWEEMFTEGKHVFYKNNELAGEAAVKHGCQSYGMLAFGKKAAIAGNGHTARGAYRALVEGGAEVTVYDRHQEGSFRADIGDYDILVNAVLWDPKRDDHIIDRKLL